MAVAEPQLTNQDSDNEQQEPEVPRIDLTVKMTHSEREDLARQLRYEIDRYDQDVRIRRGNQEQWRRDFELYPTGRSTRWKHASDVPSPITRIYAQSHHTRLDQQVIHAVPPFAVIAKTPQAMEAAPQIEEALAACLDEAEWPDSASQLHGELAVVGNCFIRTTYDQIYRRCPVIQLTWDENQFTDLLHAGAEPQDAHSQAVQTDASGAPIVELAWENKLVHSGVKFKVIPWEDGIIIPASIRDPEDARGIGERLTIRGSELKAGADSGKYFKEEVDELLTHSQDASPRDRTERLFHQGISPDAYGPHYGNTHEDPLFRDYLCYELCWQMDANKDGEYEWVVVTYHHATQKVLRLQYLPYEHGMPYYQLFRYYRRPRELFGMGIAEMLAMLQDADSAVLNQLIDAADLSLNMHGNFFYDQTAGLDLTKFDLKLGTPIFLESISGIKDIIPPTLPAEHYRVHEMFKDMAELITASSNPSLGKATDTQKTLGEVQIVQSAAQMIAEEVASGVARDWAKVWDQVRWLYAQYGDNGEVQYRKTAKPSHQFATKSPEQHIQEMISGAVPDPGEAGFGSIPAELMVADVDIVPTGLSQLSDMQSRVQQATVVQATLLTHPLTQGDMEIEAMVLDNYLQSVRFPIREKIMALVYQRVQQIQQQQMMMQQMQALGMGGPPGQGGPEQGGGEAGPGPPPPGGGHPSQVPGTSPPGAPPLVPKGMSTGKGNRPMPPQPGGGRLFG